MTPSLLRVELRFGPDDIRFVGTLAAEGTDVYFQYDESYLAAGGPSISPYNLPLAPGLQRFDRRGGMEVFGVFEDAMPDAWGRRITDQHFHRTLGRAPETLERLAYVGEAGMGALTFHPPAGEEGLLREAIDLAALAEEAWAFDDHRVEEVLPELRVAAGSSGGARPKVLVGLRRDGGPGVRVGAGALPDDHEPWIVKFNSRSDGPDAGPLEFAYRNLAERAGATVPDARLLVTPMGRFFATRRFDRPAPGRRLHMHSAAGLLHANFRTPGQEYDLLFRLVEGLTHDHREKVELFRRACLNVLASNRDDHLKNFGLLMDAAGRWTLSPLYDFTFHEGPNGWQTMSVAGEGREPGRADLVRLARQVDLAPRHADPVLERVAEAAGEFESFARAAGVSEAAISRIAGRLAAIGRR